MTEFVVKLFVFLVGFGTGFLTACLGSAQIIAEKHDLKKELEKTKAERDELKKAPEVIEIKDPRLPNADFFEPF